MYKMQFGFVNGRCHDAGRCAIRSSMAGEYTTGGRGLGRALVAAALGAMAWPALAQAGTDVVVTTSGDRLVGEIKRLEKEVLVFSTDYSDSDFRIKWGKVARVESDREYLVETFKSLRGTGTLRTDAAEPTAASVGGQSIPFPDIATIQPVERTLRSRFDAGFSLGLSGTRANSARQFTAGGELSYKDDRRVVTASTNLFASSQSGAPRTSRWDASSEYRRFVGRRYYAMGTGSFLSSDEQSLDLRSTLGGGLGWYVLRSPTQHLAVAGGLAWTNERYRDPATPVANSAETFGGFEFKTERLKVFDLVSQGVILPSLTVAGRYRLNYKLDLDFNLPGDWFFRTGFYGNFDSKPPAGLSRNDYGWSNAFGLKF